MVESLAEIVKRHQDEGGATDKMSTPHGFVEFYEEMFEPYREVVSKVVEIGVNRGASLRMWDEYFFKAHIYGLDVRFHASAMYLPRTTTHRVDQSNKEQLGAFANEYGPFEIIIDDGSHIWGHQITSFETLWPSVKSGGLYVVEDVLTSYEKFWPRHKDGGISAVEYFKGLIDEVNYHGNDRQDRMKMENRTLYQRTVKNILFRPNMIAIKKR